MTVSESANAARTRNEDQDEDGHEWEWAADEPEQAEPERTGGDHGGGACGPVRFRTGFAVTADGGYAACLATVDGGRLVERWTLDGPEPYAVLLPGGQPEEPGTAVSPLPDGRVLVLREVADRHDAVLLYPAGPGTGETTAASLYGDTVRLLPPSPVPGVAFVLVGVAGTTEVWQVLGAPGGEAVRVLGVEGRCSGGVWLDRGGRLLALDRELDGVTKTVAADLHTGVTSPLLHITDGSDDRLVLAEPDSGLLVLRSDAPGETRLGWGVLGSRRPVRFPDALCVAGAQLSPVAAQPGQILSPESVVVALRAEAPGGAESLALWRPGERRVHWRTAPEGWLGGLGAWHDAQLRVPYAGTGAGAEVGNGTLSGVQIGMQNGFAAYGAPAPEPEPNAGLNAGPNAEPPAAADAAPDSGPTTALDSGPSAAPPAAAGTVPRASRPAIAPRSCRAGREPGRPKPARRALAVLPLQQSPLSTGS